jgi:RNA ligase (TIGR02306 family)
VVLAEEVGRFARKGGDVSEFKVEVVEVGAVEKHPNADRLEIAKVADYPVIIRAGEFAPGARTVYVPIDAVVPDVERWSFLKGHRRIKAARLRGIFSMGLLTAADPAWPVGLDVREALGIEKYEPAEHASMGGENESPPPGAPCYTDIEGLRRHRHVLQPGEEVVLTEKIHGANARYLWTEGRLWAGSRTCWKRPDPGNLWWRVAEREGLAAKLREEPDVVLFGEAFGQVQDLKYGAGPGEVFFRAFDAFDLRTGQYRDHDAFVQTAARIGVATVPLLHRGPWDPDALAALACGPSTLGNHCREGFVVRPIRERHEHMGRVILKNVGEDYLLRKGA